ncbi:hypothetical protein DFS34DRAFT_651966 [Phlyctochytrium arcticum]|nr:hypothetical protein DFS34DRAFT_651966 [Phlyctochytrium arcticum]
MLANSALRALRPSARLARGGSSTPGSWGPMNFAGANWRGDGAVPFNTSSRIRFQLTFWTMVIVGLGLPFANTEKKIAPLREGVRAEYAEFRENKE